MRITSQMLAANQLKAGIEPSSKTLLDYIQNDDNDSLTSLLSKKLTLQLLHLLRNYRKMLTRILKMMLILLQRMQLNSQMKNPLFLLMQKRLVIILQYMLISNL